MYLYLLVLELEAPPPPSYSHETDLIPTPTLKICRVRQLFPPSIFSIKVVCSTLSSKPWSQPVGPVPKFFCWQYRPQYIYSWKDLKFPEWTNKHLKVSLYFHEVKEKTFVFIEIVPPLMITYCRMGHSYTKVICFLTVNNVKTDGNIWIYDI